MTICCSSVLYTHGGHSLSSILSESSSTFPATMLHSFLKGEKLCSWLSQSDCPPIIHECKVLLDCAYRTPGSIGGDDGDGAAPADNLLKSNVPQDLHALIGQCTAVLCAQLHTHGVYYCWSSTHIGNSLILFYLSGNYALSPVPGSIKYIYESNRSWHFAVQWQWPLLASRVITADPFTIYPHFPAKLYSSILEDRLESVQVGWVTSHYAQWAISSEQVVVLSLCRVRLRLLLLVCLKWTNFT